MRHRGIESNLDEAVQRVFVHFVERHIHQPRKIAFDEQTPTDQLAHQAADGAVLAERYQ
jgi:elongation factor P--beta-lysine ligase